MALIDSMPMRVCHHRRINRHKIFEEVAQRGKHSVEGFYGFKLHLVIHDGGELMALFVTPGKIDDRQILEQLTQGLTGQRFGDKAYLSMT